MNPRPLFAALSAAAVSAAALAFGGCAASGTPTPEPALSVPATSTLATAAAPSSPPLVVPDVTPARFLQLSDGGYDAHGGREIPAENQAALLANACGAPATSEQKLIERSSFSMSYRFSDPEWTYDGDVEEIISRYEPGGAAEYLTEIEQAVASCPHKAYSDSPATVDYAIVPAAVVGNDSVLITEYVDSHPTEFKPYRTSYTTMKMIIRAGDATILLRVTGWEGSDVKREHLDRLVQAALTRATA
jgi:hypothetical protein